METMHIKKEYLKLNVKWGASSESSWIARFKWAHEKKINKCDLSIVKI